MSLQLLVSVGEHVPLSIGRYAGPLRLRRSSLVQKRGFSATRNAVALSDEAVRDADSLATPAHHSSK
jgi:hypothetical protein